MERAVIEALLEQKKKEYQKIVDELAAMERSKTQLLQSGVELQGAVRVLEELLTPKQ